MSVLACLKCFASGVCACMLQVYERVAGQEVLALDRRMLRLRSHCGAVAGSVFALFAVLDFLFLLLLRWFLPDDVIDVAVDASGPGSRWSQSAVSEPHHSHWRQDVCKEAEHS